MSFDALMLLEQPQRNDMVASHYLGWNLSFSSYGRANEACNKECLFRQQQEVALQQQERRLKQQQEHRRQQHKAWLESSKQQSGFLEHQGEEQQDHRGQQRKAWLEFSKQQEEEHDKFRGEQQQDWTGFPKQDNHSQQHQPGEEQDPTIEAHILLQQQGKQEEHSKLMPQSLLEQGMKMTAHLVQSMNLKEDALKAAHGSYQHPQQEQQPRLMQKQQQQLPFATYKQQQEQHQQQQQQYYQQEHRMDHADDSDDKVAAGSRSRDWGGAQLLEDDGVIFSSGIGSHDLLTAAHSSCSSSNSSHTNCSDNSSHKSSSRSSSRGSSSTGYAEQDVVARNVSMDRTSGPNLQAYDQYRDLVISALQQQLDGAKWYSALGEGPTNVASFSKGMSAAAAGAGAEAAVSLGHGKGGHNFGSCCCCGY
jgi:hypothetical protein